MSIRDIQTQPIKKGAKVRVYTTNGGQIDGTLSHDYTPTYGISLNELSNRTGEIAATRIKSIIWWFDAETRDHLIPELDAASADAAGVLRWAMGNAVPPWSYEEGYGRPMPAAMQAAYQKDLDRHLLSYKKNAKPPSEEELFEMRAAFGEGAEVVNVFTGRRTQL